MRSSYADSHRPAGYVGLGLVVAIMVGGCASATTPVATGSPSSTASMAEVPSQTAAQTSAPTPGASSPSPAASSGLPELFAGLPYTMDLPGWLGGGPARWDAQIQSLTAAGSATTKVAVLKGFDLPIVGERFFAIDAETDLAVHVSDPAAIPAGYSDKAFVSAIEQQMIAGLTGGEAVTPPVSDLVGSPVGGGEATRIRWVTHSVDVTGAKEDEARVGYLFAIDGKVYAPLFTFPVRANLYDRVGQLVATFRPKLGT
jgi:hypothetical protein